MIERFITAFIIHFVVIDPLGTASIFLAVAGAKDRARKMRTALEGTMVATMIMLFVAVCGACILGYLNIFETAFKIADGIILFLVALDMPATTRQASKRADGTGESLADEIDSHNLAIYPLAIPLLAGPSAIMSVIVVNASFADSIAGVISGYAALIAVMVATGIIL